MSLKDKEKWDSKYLASGVDKNDRPAFWLRDNLDLMPEGGRVLDLAMGAGRNSIFLAQAGYKVFGVDISDAGIDKARAESREKEVTIFPWVEDLDQIVLPEQFFDIVICFYFLDRRLFPEIKKTLKPGGVLVFETFTVDHLTNADFKKDWVLGPNELLNAFSDFRVLNYKDSQSEGKAVASMIAKR